MATDHYVTPAGELVYDLTNTRGDVLGTRTTTLDAVMGLDAPPVRVYVDPDDRATHVLELPGVYAPENLPDDDDAELARMVCADGWEPLTGFTGQHGYRGPVMHPSETIGGALARRILSTPGVYAVATVDDPDTGESSGWVVLYRGEA